MPTSWLNADVLLYQDYDNFVCILYLVVRLSIVRGRHQEFNPHIYSKLHHLSTDKDWTLVNLYGFRSPISTHDMTLYEVNHLMLVNTR